MAKRVQTGLDVDGALTTGGQSVLSEADMTKAQAGRIKTNPRLFSGAVEPTGGDGAVDGDWWLDTSGS